ncbi:MAG: aspartyl protease [bacterium]|nr:aspartyl protease [bacterium]
MGLTYVVVEIANPEKSKVRHKLRMLVDSGAVYSVVPADVVKILGIIAEGEDSFILANGDEINRKLGSAKFFYKDHFGPSKVILGEPGDTAIIGIVTLESLGFALDPIRRELRPMKMLLV